MPSTFHPRKIGLTMAAIGVLILSFDSVLIRLSDSHFFTVVFWRGLLSGSAIFLSLLLIHRRNALNYFKRISIFQVGIACSHAAGALCFVVSIHFTLVTHTLVILAATPLFAAILSYFLLKESITKPIIITIGLALAGITCMAFDSQHETFNQKDIWLGDLAAVATAFLLALTLTLSRKSSASLLPSIGLSGFITSIICLALMPTAFQTINNHNWLPLFIMGFIVAPISFSLIMSASSYLPTPEISLLLLIESLLGPIWVWLVIGEQPGLYSVIGGAVTLCALIGLNVYQASKAAVINK